MSGCFSVALLMRYPDIYILLTKSVPSAYSVPNLSKYACNPCLYVHVYTYIVVLLHSLAFHTGLHAVSYEHILCHWELLPLWKYLLRGHNSWLAWRYPSIIDIIALSLSLCQLLCSDVLRLG